MPDKPIIITKSKLLAVEGKDEENFFITLLDKINITDVQVQNYGGKNKVNSILPAIIRTSGFSQIKKLAIICDADNSADDNFRRIQLVLKKEHLPAPSTRNMFVHTDIIDVGIYIIPGTDNGMLEDLCLRTVHEDPAMRCVEMFYTCARKLDPPPSNPAKAKAQAFLAAMPEIVYSVGVGAQKGYWDFDSPHMDNLKTFLKKFI